MACPRPHSEGVDGASIVGRAVGRPAGSGGEAVVAPGSFVLGLSAGGALQGHPPCAQAAGGRAARRVDAPHLRVSGGSEGPSGLRAEAIGGAQAAATAATGQPVVAVGIPNV